MANKVTELVADSIKDFLAEEGLELYHVTFTKEGKDHYLRVYIDKPEKDEYVGVEDCEKVSQYLSDVLDEKDPIGPAYFLEVSSPGMDRELITDEHFQRYTGDVVDVRLYKARNGEKTLTGELIAKTSDTLTVRTEDGEEVELPLTEVSKVQLAVII